MENQDSQPSCRRRQMNARAPSLTTFSDTETGIKLASLVLRFAPDFVVNFF